MPSDNLSAISLCTGAGGLEFAFEAMRFSTAAIVELDPMACCTIRVNRPD